MKRFIYIFIALVTLAGCKFGFEVENDADPGVYLSCIASPDSISYYLRYASPLGVNAGDIPEVKVKNSSISISGRSLDQNPLIVEDGIRVYPVSGMLGTGDEVRVVVRTETLGDLDARTAIPAQIGLENVSMTRTDMMGIIMDDFTFRLDRQPEEGEYVGLFMSRTVSPEEMAWGWEEYPADSLSGPMIDYLSPATTVATNADVELCQVDFCWPRYIRTWSMGFGLEEPFTIIPAAAFRNQEVSLMVTSFSAIYGGYPGSEEEAEAEPFDPMYTFTAMSVSEEFYRYSLAQYRSRTDFLALMGLAPAQFAWSNVNGGFGFCGAVSNKSTIEIPLSLLLEEE